MAAALRFAVQAKISRIFVCLARMDAGRFVELLDRSKGGGACLSAGSGNSARAHNNESRGLFLSEPLLCELDPGTLIAQAIDLSSPTRVAACPLDHLPDADTLGRHPSKR